MKSTLFSKLIIPLLLLVIVILLGIFVLSKIAEKEGEDTGIVATSSDATLINSFEECIAAGNPAMESFPRRCNADGQTFTEVVEGVTDMGDRIRVSTPVINSRIASPLIIRGEARGNWYFEGDFPVVLTNWDGLIIAEGYATAQGEWMTTDFVPFVSTIIFDKPSFGERGFLILQRNNASGLPEHDAAIEIPVYFE